MNHVKVLVLTFSLCMFLAINLRSQVQKPAGARSVDAARTASRPVEPDSPATSSTVAAGPQAVVPRLMKFSGVVHDATGNPAHAGSVDVTFSLYSTEAGGNPLWYETQTVQSDELGRYTALLGAMHTDGLPIDLFTSGEVRWLGIQVVSEAEQQPRVLLVSVPYALKAGDAETLGGKPASAYMLSDLQNGTASADASSASMTRATQTTASGKNPKSRTANNSALTACTSVTSNGSAVVNSIALFTTACNIQSSVLTQVSGNLGFGTTTPQARLHIFGPDISDADARFNFILGDSTPATAGVGGGIDFSGYYNGTTNRAGFANIRGVKENATQGDYASAMIFDTRANGGNQTERMRITSAGNVGIGTTTPAAKLDVVGNFNIPLTVSGGSMGVITMGGSSFIHACCGSNGNVFVGSGAGNFSTTGATNTAIGFDALHSNTTGSYNTASGFYALFANTIGDYNTADGREALASNSTGNFNSAGGFRTLQLNTTGNYNTGYGLQALYLSDTGNSNAAFGACALLNTFGTTGSPTSCSVPAPTTGGGNTGIGINAGQTNTTGDHNTFLGFNANANSGTLTNATAIGANAVVSQSNALVLGGTGGSAVNVGIGTATPADRLQVTGGDIFVGNVTNAYNSGSDSVFVANNTGDAYNSFRMQGYANNLYLIAASSPGAAQFIGAGIKFMTSLSGAGQTERMSISDDGFVGICIGSSSASRIFQIGSGCGHAQADGWDTYSSRRFKTNIHTLHSALGTVERLRGVTYNDKSNGKPEVGVIAEEVAGVLPQVVAFGKDGKAEGVDYSRLTAVLIEATKEQQRQIHAQWALIRKQQAQIASQHASLKTQQAQIAQLGSQVSIIQASLKDQRRTGSTVRLAKAVAPTTPAARSLLIVHTMGDGN